MFIFSISWTLAGVAALPFAFLTSIYYVDYSATAPYIWTENSTCPRIVESSGCSLVDTRVRVLIYLLLTFICMMWLWYREIEIIILKMNLIFPGNTTLWTINVPILSCSCRNSFVPLHKHGSSSPSSSCSWHQFIRFYSHSFEYK